MTQIVVLPENVANKIAAGEVVERPASVVKELVENSIDAGARTITVEIEGAGSSLIGVSDDGNGMGRGDALLAIERHATSKIRNANDLKEIRTLGFRGEALPSIAAVSKFEMLTRDETSLAGTRVRITGGRLINVGEEARTPGTTIRVRSLFYNTPARRKFLRSPQTERVLIIKTVVLLSLANQNISFRLMDGGKEILYSPARKELENRVVDLLGRDFAAQSTPFHYRREGVVVHGYAGKPSATRSSRRDQYIFVNSRPVSALEVMRGVAKGYRTLVPGGRHPICLVFVDVETSDIDVNVHPTKKEVRFSNPSFVESVIAKAISQAVKSDLPSRAREEKVSYVTEKISATAIKQFPAAKEEALPVTPRVTEEQVELPAKHLMRVVGQLKGLYIICEADNGLVIIDQHAAHERVLYERYVRDYREGEVEVQRLLIPQVIELGPAESSAISNHMSELRAIGYDIDPFGERAFAVGAVPAHVSSADVLELVRDLVSEREGGDNDPALPDTMEERLIAVSCRSAVKRRDLLEPLQLQELVDGLLRCEQPSSCPHGRPTMWSKSWDELDRSFER